MPPSCAIWHGCALYTGREWIFTVLDSWPGRPFVVRIPLIPGVNDTRENMLQTCLLIKDAPGLERVEILRYHKTAGAKYAMIGRTYAPGFDTGAEPRVHDVFSDYNLKTLIQ